MELAVSIGLTCFTLRAALFSKIGSQRPFHEDETSRNYVIIMAVLTVISWGVWFFAL